MATQPATTFHSFSKLPIELRLKIWLLAIEPSTVCLEPGGGPPAATLSVCSESRNATRHLYTLQFLVPESVSYFGKGLEDFSLGVPKGCVPNAIQRAVFINFDIDVLYISSFRPKTDFSYFSITRDLRGVARLYPTQLSKAKRVMVAAPQCYQGWDGFEMWWEWPTSWQWFFTIYERCESVIFVFGGHWGAPLDHLVGLDDGVLVEADEEKSMNLVRLCMEKSREDGWGVGLDVQFARVKRGEQIREVR